MIGLRNLPDGGHIVNHPDGPMHVTVRDQFITSADLARWGDPLVAHWPAPDTTRLRWYWTTLLATARKGGDAAAQV